MDWFDPDTLTHWGAILAGHRRNRHSYRRDASQTNEPGTGVHGRRHVTNNSERNVVILKARLGKRVPRFAQVSTRHPDRKDHFRSDYPVLSHRMSEASVDLQFYPPIAQGHEPIISDVIFTDNFGNEYQLFRCLH